MRLPHRDGRVHLLLLSTHVDLTVHGICIRATCTLDVLSLDRTLHGLPIHHLVHLVSTVLWLPVCVRLTAERLLEGIIFTIYHHG